MDQKIYLKDWLLLKPYEKQTATDVYYLGICNKVRKVIQTKKYLPLLQSYMNDFNIDLFSCFLSSYLEDLVSETGIFKAFVQEHLRLYGKQLPFYNVEEYYEEEINPQDISFLIWYYLNTAQDDVLISPFRDFIDALSVDIFKIFDEAWEYAPENLYLKSFYQISENETDFYVARKLIDTVLFKTYLFFPDTGIQLKIQELEIIESKRYDQNIMSYLNDNRDYLLHFDHTRLLSLKGKEWASKILHRNHPLRGEFLEISQKISGYFLYKGQDNNNIFIEHIASGKRFDLTKKSFDHSNSLKEENTIMFMGITCWKNEWWFSGTFFQQPFDPDLILDEKNSMRSRRSVNFLEQNNEAAKEILQSQFEAFKKYNNGSQIAFLHKKSIEEFYKSYIEYYNSTLDLPEAEIKAANQRLKDSGLFGTKKGENIFPEESESGLVFFNPKGGCEFAFSVNAAFPMPTNPYFNEEESDDHVLRLLTDSSISAELVKYCIDNCKSKLPFFNEGVGSEMLEDIDFLLRFWKKSNYHSKPTITFN